MSSIAKNIKKLRQKKGLTQEELAEKLYVTRQAVSNWETGKNQPDVDTLKSLAEVVETDIKDVIYGPAFDLDRRKRILAAAVLCVLTAAAWGVHIPFARWAENMLRRAYYTPKWVILSHLVEPFVYILSGLALSALLALWMTPVTNRKVRRGMVFAGAAICLFGLCAELFYWFGPGGAFAKWFRLFFYSRFWLKNQWVFLIPGILFFWGSRRKAG